MMGRIEQYQECGAVAAPFRAMVDADLELERAADALEPGQVLRVEEGYYFHRLNGATILIPTWYMPTRDFAKQQG